MVIEDGFSCSSSWSCSAAWHWSLPKTPRQRSQGCNTTYPPSLHSAERVAGETASMTGAGRQAIPDCRIGTGTLRCGETVRSLDLGTLGGPNSSVTWNVKNTAGIIVGISQTADPEPLGEAWSSAAFYSTPNNVGYINLGFVWEETRPDEGTSQFSGRKQRLCHRSQQPGSGSRMGGEWCS